MIKHTAAAGAALIIIAAIAALIINAPLTGLEIDASGANQSKFDHSGCQYPMRLSNPPDGCDNSDLACPSPENIKNGTEYCNDGDPTND